MGLPVECSSCSAGSLFSPILEILLVWKRAVSSSVVILISLPTSVTVTNALHLFVHMLCAVETFCEPRLFWKLLSE